MAEIVNLKRVRKQRTREAHAEDAAAARAKHGTTKAERLVTREAEALRERTLDHAKLEKP